jgi:hypothetical protein
MRGKTERMRQRGEIREEDPVLVKKQMERNRGLERGDKREGRERQENTDEDIERGRYR